MQGTAPPVVHRPCATRAATCPRPPLPARVLLAVASLVVGFALPAFALVEVHLPGGAWIPLPPSHQVCFEWTSTGNAGATQADVIMNGTVVGGVNCQAGSSAPCEAGTFCFTADLAVCEPTLQVHIHACPPPVYIDDISPPVTLHLYEPGPDGTPTVDSLNCLSTPPDCLPACPWVGEPIDVTTGRMTYSVQDAFIPGNPPLDFTRHYSSFDTGFEGLFGPGWRFTYEETVECSPDGGYCTYTTADGRRWHFGRIVDVLGDPTDDWNGVAPYHFSHQEILGAQHYLVRSPDGVERRFQPVEALGGAYRLHLIDHPAGDQVAIDWSQPWGVVITSGNRAMSLVYATHLPENYKIAYELLLPDAAPNGRSVSYCNSSPFPSGASCENLAQFPFPEAPRRQLRAVTFQGPTGLGALRERYAYDELDATLLREARDAAAPAGHVIESWSFLDGRAVTFGRAPVANPDGGPDLPAEKLTVAYGTTQTMVTDGEGRQTTYTVDRVRSQVLAVAGGPCPRCDDPGASSREYEWDTDATVITSSNDSVIPRVRKVVDGAGIVTEYEFETGNAPRLPNPGGWSVTRLTEAAGTTLERFTTFCYKGDESDTVFARFTTNRVKEVRRASLGTCTVPATDCGGGHGEMSIRNTWQGHQLLSRTVEGCAGAVTETRKQDFEYCNDLLAAVWSPRRWGNPAVGSPTRLCYYGSVFQGCPGCYVPPAELPPDWATFDGWLRQVRVPVDDNPSHDLVYTVTDYHRNGQVKKLVDPNGVETEYSIEPGGLGRPTATVVHDPQDPLNIARDIRTEYAYDLADGGQLTEIRRTPGLDPDPTPTTVMTLVEDAAHRLATATDPLGNQLRLVHSIMGDLRRRALGPAASPATETYSRAWLYDNRANPLSTTYEYIPPGPLPPFPPTATETYLHDPAGRLQMSRDGLNHRDFHRYDALGRLSEVRSFDQNGQLLAQTAYEYDVHDNLVEIHPPNQMATTYRYDDFGNLLSVGSGDTGTTTHKYDLAGNPYESMDARGVVLARNFDWADRLTLVTSPQDPGARREFFYDRYAPGDPCDEPGVPEYTIGRLAKVITGTIHTCFAYDFAGRVVQRRQWEPPSIPAASAQVTRFAYDRRSNLIAVTYPPGHTVSYEYDDADQVQRVSWRESINHAPLVLADNIVHAPFGPAIAWDLPTGAALPLVASRLYDRNYQLLASTIGPPASPLVGRELRYNQDLDLVERTRTDPSLPALETYVYDALHRLTQASGQWGTLAWDYDPAGNRTAEHRTPPGQPLDTTLCVYDNQWLNRLEKLTDQAGAPKKYFGHDLTGNMDRVGVDPAELTRYGHDVFGRLATIDKPLDGHDGHYLYGADGHPVRVVDDTAAGVWEEFVYGLDGSLLAERSQATGRWREYVWIEGRPLARIDFQAGAVEGVWLYETDQLGTPYAMIDRATGNLARHVATEPFGTPTNILASPIDDRLRLPGQWEDTLLTGLYQNWHRDYNPTVGRYLQSDPIVSQHPVPYGYSANSPLAHLDPDGQFVWVVAAVGVGIAAEWAWTKYAHPAFTEAAESLSSPSRQYGEVNTDPEVWGPGRATYDTSSAVATYTEGVEYAAKKCSMAVSFWTLGTALNRVRNAYRHFKDHGRDFGATNALDYVRQSRRFTSAPPPGTLTKVRPDGDTVFYDPKSNTFAVTDALGSPRTMFKPDPRKHGYATNLDYFNAQ